LVQGKLDGSEDLPLRNGGLRLRYPYDTASIDLIVDDREAKKG